MLRGPRPKGACCSQPCVCLGPTVHSPLGAWGLGWGLLQPLGYGVVRGRGRGRALRNTVEGMRVGAEDGGCGGGSPVGAGQGRGTRPDAVFVWGAEKVISRTGNFSFSDGRREGVQEEIQVGAAGRVEPALPWVPAGPPGTQEGDSFLVGPGLPSFAHVNWGAGAALRQTKVRSPGGLNPFPGTGGAWGRAAGGAAGWSV